jgi:hypothetical protein
MQNYRLLELEVSYVRPHGIEKRLELARFSREGRVSGTGFRERAYITSRKVVISLGQSLKARLVLLGAGASGS